MSESSVELSRQRVNAMRKNLHQYWVGKEEILDLMTICTIAQEPLLLAGPPGTAKSDVVCKFVQALGLDTKSDDYFEYTLNQYTEPGEIYGPIDINKLGEGSYIRRTRGKLPVAKIAFLDEVFKSNSAILNTLLTVINERKFIQDGEQVPVPLMMLFGATNEIPDTEELGAFKDRFTLKVLSSSARDEDINLLLAKGLQNEIYKNSNQTPWVGFATLEDFVVLKKHMDEALLNEMRDHTHHRHEVFSDTLFNLFLRILKSLEQEFRFTISDRKIIKLYKLIRTRAMLLHGGVVNKSDLQLLRYLSDRLEDVEPMAQQVDRMITSEA